MITFENEGYATDTFFNEDNCVKRLLEEWEEHGKLIVAYDFDATVNGTYQTDCDCDQMIELIRACKEMGCTLIVFTRTVLSTTFAMFWGADGISAINTLLGMKIDINKRINYTF